MPRDEHDQDIREEMYALLIEQVHSLLEGETNRIANLANAAALLHKYLENVNWVGFYLCEEEELVLGPFQGSPACTRIPLGKGVCGTAAQQLKTLRVADVHQFAGHIACDSASKSEMVIPILKNGQLLGVLDIDSPVENRFDEVDQLLLEACMGAIATHLQ
jgi:L-methionine (R)-S-oxide reductase